MSSFHLHSGLCPVQYPSSSSLLPVLLQVLLQVLLPVQLPVMLLVLVRVLLLAVGCCGSR